MANVNVETFSKVHLTQIKALEKRRRNVHYHKQIYQQKIIKAYARGIKQRNIKVGDLMLRVADYVRKGL